MPGIRMRSRTADAGIGTPAATLIGAAHLLFTDADGTPPPSRGWSPRSWPPPPGLHDVLKMSVGAAKLVWGQSDGKSLWLPTRRQSGFHGERASGDGRSSASS
jgi:hypothetical protein